jgi:3-hydroxyisobutyrate dehydrogenase-like beta-hydroxyacid dehydrogenase
VRVGFLGLGEAGRAIAGDLAEQGVEVVAWDPQQPPAVPGVRIAEEAGDVADADVVLSVNSATAAVAAAKSVVPRLTGSTVYADLNSGSATLKRLVAELIRPTGALFADVALMGTVPGNGIHTPALVAGPGAERFVAEFGPLGMPVESVGDQPGAAATRKLLRSVFMKGIAVTAIEALRAAEAADCREWLWADIAGTLARADERLLRRLVEGTERHAERRAHEMADVAALLRELGVACDMSEAAANALGELARESR